jgi:hypothetical protein
VRDWVAGAFVVGEPCERICEQAAAP